MPDNVNLCYLHSFSPIEIHEIIRSTGKPNFLGAHLPVTSMSCKCSHLAKPHQRLLGSAAVAAVAVWFSHLILTGLVLYNMTWVIIVLLMNFQLTFTLI